MGGMTVKVSRKWKDPTIAIEVEVARDNEEISVKVPLVSFLAEIVAEVGNPALLMTQDGLRKRVFAAAEVLVAKMKGDAKLVL